MKPRTKILFKIQALIHELRAIEKEKLALERKIEEKNRKISRLCQIDNQHTPFKDAY